MIKERAAHARFSRRYCPPFMPASRISRTRWRSTFTPPPPPCRCPPARSRKKCDREDVEPPSSPAPVNTVGGTLSDIPPAAEPARNAVSLSPTASDSTSAAVVCALSQSSVPPVPDGGTRHDSAAMTPQRTALSERCSPSSPARKRALVHPAVAAIFA